MAENIKTFLEIGKKDVGTAGGKGASLGEMFNAGMPVPEGFVITAQAYQEFVKDIQADIIKKVNSIDVEETARLDMTAKEIQKMIQNVKMGQEMKKEIIENYHKLGSNEFVAVRSSATAEDLPDASFAGQQATYLNVRGDEKVAKAVIACFASLFTPRAIYYRVKNNFKHEDVLIAVVIQKMVNSKKAGVMFTVNPVTNNYDEMIIEGAFGLGELVVGGQITPDSYIVEKKGMVVKDVNIGSKSKGMFRDENGNNYEKENENPDERVLSDEELKELAELGVKIEKHYGKPQDIEWAMDGKVYIVQSRPVTTLK